MVGVLLVLALPGRGKVVSAQAPKGRPGLDGRSLAVLAAAEMTAAGNAPTALGLFYAARSMALWGDWPHKAPDDAEPAFAQALDADLLRGIKDLRIPTPRENRAVDEIIFLASQTSPRAFAASAGENKDVTVIQLQQQPRKFRGEVVRVEGKLTRLRRLEASPRLRELGLKRLYEGVIESYERGSVPALVLVIALPAGIKPGKRPDRGVIFDGYFVKKALRRGNDPRLGPLLIGRTLRLAKGRFPQEEPKDKALPLARLLTGVQDGKPAPSADRNLEEFLGYCDTLLLAAQTPAAAFEKSGRETRSVTYTHLLKDPAGHRGEVVHLEGRLALLRRWRVPAFLRRKGLEDAYEGWVFGPGSNPYCVVFTDLGPGLKVGEQLDVPVKFDGYFFKTFRYPANKKQRLAPLLVGRALRPAFPAHRAKLGGAFSVGFVVVLTALVGGTIVLVVGLGWWFRRGDRKLRARLARTHPEPVFDAPPEVDRNGH
jgi:hypothetical protein